MASKYSRRTLITTGMGWNDGDGGGSDDDK